MNLEEFKKYYKNHTTVETAEYFGIGRTAVWMIAKQLGMYKQHNRKSSWSQFEEQLKAVCDGVMTVDELASVTGKSAEACRCKLKSIKKRE